MVTLVVSMAPIVSAPTRSVTSSASVTVFALRTTLVRLSTAAATHQSISVHGKERAKKGRVRERIGAEFFLTVTAWLKI